MPDCMSLQYEAIGIADKMKSGRLMQNFCPAKETNRTHSRPLCGGFVDTGRAKRMRQDDRAEFISASVGKFPYPVL